MIWVFVPGVLAAVRRRALAPQKLRPGILTGRETARKVPATGSEGLGSLGTVTVPIVQTFGTGPTFRIVAQ